MGTPPPSVSLQDPRQATRAIIVPVRRRALQLALIATFVIGAAIRADVVMWSDPWEPHHPDEHILPLEALASWEGITPREIGWPGSTTRLVVSAAAASRCLAQDGSALWPRV